MIKYDKIIDNINIDKKWVVFDYNYLKITNNNALLCCYNKIIILKQLSFRPIRIYYQK